MAIDGLPDLMLYEIDAADAPVAMRLRCAPELARRSRLLPTGLGVHAEDDRHGRIVRFTVTLMSDRGGVELAATMDLDVGDTFAQVCRLAEQQRVLLVFCDEDHTIYTVREMALEPQLREALGEIALWAGSCR